MSIFVKKNNKIFKNVIRYIFKYDFSNVLLGYKFLSYENENVE